MWYIAPLSHYRTQPAMRTFVRHSLGPLLALVLSGLPPAHAVAPTPCTGLQETVEYLMGQVTDSDLIFIRNGRPHRGTEAAEHMRKKYEHFQNKIKTANDFIDLAATKSLMSGSPYLVVTKEGAHVPTAEWLRAELSACRAGNRPPAPGPASR